MLKATCGLTLSFNLVPDPYSILAGGHSVMHRSITALLIDIWLSPPAILPLPRPLPSCWATPVIGDVTNRKASHLPELPDFGVPKLTMGTSTCLTSFQPHRFILCSF